MNNKRLTEEFLAVVAEFCANEHFAALLECGHHGRVTRLQHSLDVAHVCYRYYKARGLEWRPIVEAALVHDFYTADWREGEWKFLQHCSMHAEEAVRNAQKFLLLTEEQKHAIKTHMWPMVRRRPYGRMGWLLCLADKYCFMVELFWTAKELFVRER